MKIIYIIGIVLLISLAASGWFYWFELRPSNIRQECHVYSKDKSGSNYDYYQAYYQVCLHSKGL